MTNLRWRLWHIYRWRLLAAIAGGVARRAERLHDRLHRTTDPFCDMCLDRENES